MLLDKKIAIITGTNRGIGKSMIKIFAQNGAKIFAIARTPGCIDEYADELNEKYIGQVIPIYFDVRNNAAAKEKFIEIYKQNDKIDILINNAGIMNDALIGMITENNIKDLFETNVYPIINLTQLVSRFMMKKNNGSIINIASIIGTNGNAGQSVYSATKGAVISFTKSSAKELAPFGIRVNAIAPGIINTEILNNVPENLLKKRIENIKLGRVGTPDEIANVAAFLSSDQASYICGQILGVDGCAIL